MKPFIYYRFFALYLWLIKFGYNKHNNKRVYDHLGLIDTLGYNSEETLLTSYYSNELTCLFFIKLPFDYRLKLDAEDKTVTIIK